MNVDSSNYKDPDEDLTSSKARQTSSSSLGFRKSFAEGKTFEMNRT